MNDQRPDVLAASAAQTSWSSRPSAAWARTGKRYGVGMELRPCVVTDVLGD